MVERLHVTATTYFERVVDKAMYCFVPVGLRVLVQWREHDGQNDLKDIKGVLQTVNSTCV